MKHLRTMSFACLFLAASWGVGCTQNASDDDAAADGGSAQLQGSDTASGRGCTGNADGGTVEHGIPQAADAARAGEPYDASSGACAEADGGAVDVQDASNGAPDVSAPEDWDDAATLDDAGGDVPMADAGAAPLPFESYAVGAQRPEPSPER